MRPRRDTEIRKYRFSTFPLLRPPAPTKRLRRLELLLRLLTMAGETRKWMILAATLWIQAFTGTNFDFPAYSSSLKSMLNISQVQLNYLAVATDMGKVFGWSSGLASMHLPIWVVMFIAAFTGCIAYGLQWLVIRQFITLPYQLVFVLCLLLGCSICWFNTVCFVLCIRNFPDNQTLALSLTVSFNGLSAALYTLAANAIDNSSSSVYLLLNSVVPLIVSFVALIPILFQPHLDPLPPDEVHRDSVIFLILNLLAVATGIYLIIFGSSASSEITARFFFGGAIFLLAFPFCITVVVYAKDWFRHNIHASFQLQGSGFVCVKVDDLELHRTSIHGKKEDTLRTSDCGLSPRLRSQKSRESDGCCDPMISKDPKAEESDGCCDTMISKDQLTMLCEEHTAKMLVSKLDFWLYYIAYFCGGTIGLVYSNNLGQTAQSLGQGSRTTVLVMIYSSFSFFGRLLSAAPDYARARFYFARTGWLTVALVPTPVAFFLLAGSGSALALEAGTALIGLSSGFIFAAAVSITSELFGPTSVGVNHNILITNIPIGSLCYGFLAALIYEANASPTLSLNISDSVVCMGRQCYILTFLCWGGISVLGLASSLLFFLRTKHAYENFERNRISSTQLY